MTRKPDATVPATMTGAWFPGDSTVKIDEFEVPSAGRSEVVLKTAASGICGSDLRNAYLEHRDRGERSYRNVIGGHEVAGTVVELGGGVTSLTLGDRVLLYHVSGCGSCHECRRGYMIHCGSSNRTAYGNQRHGGHASYVLADERTCVRIPQPLTMVDGALIGCGVGTAYESLMRLGVNGADRMLVVGLGPLGGAVALVARSLGVPSVLGVELSAGRRKWAQRLGLFDDVLCPEELRHLQTNKLPDLEVAVDASGSSSGRRLALECLSVWGRCGFLGEGGTVSFDVSEQLLHKEITLTGSWVTSVPHMIEVADLLARSDAHPELLVDRSFELRDVDEAYRFASSTEGGKACVTFD